MKDPAASFVCPVCGRHCPPAEASRHHVLPKSRGGRDIVLICRDCHRQIHRLFDVKALARRYNTLEKLTRTPEMQTWIHWISRKPLAPTPRPAADSWDSPFPAS